jgi:hypothetical protein
MARGDKLTIFLITRHKALDELTKNNNNNGKTEE